MPSGANSVSLLLPGWSSDSHCRLCCPGRSRWGRGWRRPSFSCRHGENIHSFSLSSCTIPSPATSAVRKLDDQRLARPRQGPRVEDADDLLAFVPALHPGQIEIEELETKEQVDEDRNEDLAKPTPLLCWLVSRRILVETTWAEEEEMKEEKQEVQTPVRKVQTSSPDRSP